MGCVRARRALESLVEGNRRFTAARLTHPRRSPQRRHEVSASQEPIAAVLGCADSRVPPEVIFDQGLGDLFVVRIAGNVLDPAVVESIEYAAEHLGVPLVLILGHSCCGAVTAVASSRGMQERPSRLSEFIGPSIDDVAGEGGSLIEDACRANARRVARELASSTGTLASLVERGELEIVPAYYDLADGSVVLL